MVRFRRDEILPKSAAWPGLSYRLIASVIEGSVSEKGYGSQAVVAINYVAQYCIC
jgi:hypothetical protein